MTTKVAVPALEVHAPATVNAGGGGGGGTQRDISATTVRVLSFGLDNVYVLDMPFIVRMVLPPAGNWKVPV